MVILDCDHTQIGASRRDGAHDVVTEALFEGYPHVRVEGEESCQIVWQVRTDCIVVGEEGDVANKSLRIWLEVDMHLFQLCHTPSGVLNQNVTGGRQLDPTGLPGEQRGTDCIFQRFDALADGRWSQIAAFGCARKITLLRNGQKHLEVNQIVLHAKSYRFLTFRERSALPNAGVGNARFFSVHDFRILEPFV